MMLALLLSLLLAATGIARDVDPELTAIAEQRVVDIQSDFSHSGMVAGTAEVLHWNQGYSDPVATAVEAWRTSPGHWAILSDPRYSRIGCAVALVADTFYAACVLGTALAVPDPPTPETLSSVAAILPDTATMRRTDA